MNRLHQDILKQYLFSNKDNRKELRLVEGEFMMKIRLSTILMREIEFLTRRQKEILGFMLLVQRQLWRWLISNEHDLPTIHII